MSSSLWTTNFAARVSKRTEYLELSSAESGCTVGGRVRGLCQSGLAGQSWEGSPVILHSYLHIFPTSRVSEMVRV